MKFTRHDLKQLRYPQHNIDTISLNYLKLYECYVSPCIAFLFLNFLPYYGRGGWGGGEWDSRDDLRFSNTTGILQKKLCGLLVLK